MFETRAQTLPLQGRADRVDHSCGPLLSLSGVHLTSTTTRLIICALSAVLNHHSLADRPICFVVGTLWERYAFYLLSNQQSICKGKEPMV